jgi:drug/metabolite transporter (DMT)-like permease
MSAAAARVPRPLVLAAAIFAVWFFWGATPAGMRLAMSSMPPFVMAAVRFAIAGSVIFAFAAIIGRARPTAAIVRNALVSGFLLLFLGNGMMSWALQYLPTGLNALLVSIAPVWLALIEWCYARIVPPKLAIAGMLLGISGIAVLFGPKSATALPLIPALVAIGSSVCWALGSAVQRHARPDNPILSTSLQMLFAAAMFAVEAAALGEWTSWDVRAMQPVAVLGLAWLIVCGSLISYPAFIYTMRHADAALATTYAYVNPLVTIGLGMLLFHEQLGASEAFAGVIILGGVALMMLPLRNDPAVVSRVV